MAETGQRMGFMARRRRPCPSEGHKAEAHIQMGRGNSEAESTPNCWDGAGDKGRFHENGKQRWTRESC